MLAATYWCVGGGIVVYRDCSEKPIEYSHLLRKVKELLKAGGVEEALALIDEHCASEEDGAEDRCPPRLRFLRGLARLEENDEKGILDLFAAAEHDPSLLAEAADAVSAWLDGAGREHDTPVLRGELTRMRMVYDYLAEERGEPTGNEKLEAPDDGLLAAMEEALASWRGEVKRAWLARRVCERAPRWQHHDMLLLMKPRLWHFLPGARERMETERRTLLRTLPLPEGTFGLQIYPFLALPAHMRNMRMHATELFVREGAPEPERPAWLQALLDVTAPLRRAFSWLGRLMGDGAPAVRMAAFSGLAAALLVWPAWMTWKMVRAEDTPRMVRDFEQRHAKMMAVRYWRQEAAADPFAPEKTVRAFLDMLLAADDWPTPPVLDAKSRESWRKRRFIPGELRQLGWQWKGCGKPEVKVEQDLAMARWPLKKKPLCMPILLRREQGRWRIAWEETRLAFERDSKGWRVVRSPRGWQFGFAGWRFVAIEGENGLRAREEEPEKHGMPQIAPPDDGKAQKRKPADVARAEQGGHMAAGNVRVWN